MTCQINFSILEKWNISHEYKETSHRAPETEERNAGTYD